MENPIISTKGTNQSIRKIMVIISLVLLIFSILCLFIIRGEINSYPSLYRAAVMRKYVPLIILVVFGCVLGFLALLLVLHLCSSYVDVYADRMEGKFIQDGIQVVYVNLSFDKITSITYARTSVYINTANTKYAVMTSPSNAKQIFDFYNSRS